MSFDRDFFEQGLKSMGISYTSAMVDTIRKYVSEIELFNPVYRLVDASDRELISAHLLDSLSAVSLIQTLSCGKSLAIADIGTGAGFPGIPLSVFMPGHSFTLVERKGRRVGFLRNALAATGLSSSVALSDCDVKNIGRHFDLIVMRAFRPLSETVKMLLPVLDRDTVLLCWKATEDYMEREIAQVEELWPGRFSFKTVEAFVPGLEKQRRFCIVSATL